VPPELVRQRESQEDALRHRLLSRYRAVGLLAGQASADIIYSTGTVKDRARWVAELVDSGTLVPVIVEGIRQLRYSLAEERPLLEATASRSRRSPALTFLAPLDSLVWDRRLLRELFGFDYTWEVYVPAAKRRHGYYVLPLLFGDRIVGRIEPRLDRRTGALAVVGVWFEPSFEPMEEPHFVPALATAVHAYREFVGAQSVTWPRTMLGRDLAGALQRHGAAA